MKKTNDEMNTLTNTVQKIRESEYNTIPREIIDKIISIEKTYLDSADEAFSEVKKIIDTELNKIREP